MNYRRNQTRNINWTLYKKTIKCTPPARPLIEINYMCEIRTLFKQKNNLGITVRINCVKIHSWNLTKKYFDIQQVSGIKRVLATNNSFWSYNFLQTLKNRKCLDGPIRFYWHSNYENFHLELRLWYWINIKTIISVWINRFTTSDWN